MPDPNKVAAYVDATKDPTAGSGPRSFKEKLEGILAINLIAGHVMDTPNPNVKEVRVISDMFIRSMAEAAVTARGGKDPRPSPNASTLGEIHRQNVILARERLETVLNGCGYVLVMEPPGPPEAQKAPI